VTIGVIELGGGFNASDLTALGLHADNVTVVSVDGGQSTSDGPSGADAEVMLDVEVIAAVAPGAKQRVYFAPNTDRRFSRRNQAGVRRMPVRVDLVGRP
jgi:kumamolisin